MLLRDKSEANNKESENFRSSGGPWHCRNYGSQAVACQDIRWHSDTHACSIVLGKTSHSKEDVLCLEPALVPQNDVTKNKQKKKAYGRQRKGTCLYQIPTRCHGLGFLIGLLFYCFWIEVWSISWIHRECHTSARLDLCCLTSEERGLGMHNT